MVAANRAHNRYDYRNKRVEPEGSTLSGEYTGAHISLKWMLGFDYRTYVAPETIFPLETTQLMQSIRWPAAWRLAAGYKFNKALSI